MPPPRASPALPDELVEEVLVRVPPDDPASLVRAALACRRYCRLVADPAFRRRRLDLHRAAGTPPPMLRVLCDGCWYGKTSSVRFVPTSTCRPPRAFNSGERAFDARHGRVLLHGRHSYRDFVVWDPITDQRVEVPRPPWSLGSGSMKTTVLCAATATGACSHIDCHRGPFIVVVVGTNDDVYNPWDSDNDCDDMFDGVYDEVSQCYRVPKDMFSCVYSSESGAWSKPAYADHHDHNVEWARSALVGNALFFSLGRYGEILKYDLGTQQMSLMSLPKMRTDMVFADFEHIELTTLEDGRLGLARVEKSNELCLWSRGEGDKVKGWTLSKVIDLKDLFPLADSIALKYCLVGFAESGCIAFVTVQGALFTIDMKSGRLMEKLCEGPGICCAVPYINFCTPALEAPSRDDGQRVGISSGKGGSSGA